MKMLPSLFMRRRVVSGPSRTGRWPGQTASPRTKTIIGRARNLGHSKFALLQSHPSTLRRTREARYFNNEMFQESSTEHSP
jgi:hypothetical protein